MDAEHGGWVVEIFLRRPYHTIAMTEAGQRDLGQTFVIFVPFANRESAEEGMSDLGFSVRYLPGRTVQGEVVDAEHLPADGQVKAIAGSVVRDGEEVGG